MVRIVKGQTKDKPHRSATVGRIKCVLNFPTECGKIKGCQREGVVSLLSRVLSEVTSLPPSSVAVFA